MPPAVQSKIKFPFCFISLTNRLESPSRPVAEFLFSRCTPAPSRNAKKLTTGTLCTRPSTRLGRKAAAAFHKIE